MSVTSSYNPPPQPLTYGFVDAANFSRSLQEELRREELVHMYERILPYQFLQRRCDRLFIFDASNESSLPKWVDDIRKEPNVIAELGSLDDESGEIGKSCSECGKPSKKQQGVDVSLAVKALHFAHRGKMERAILYSGDGDFLPLIRALVDLGVKVEVFSFGDPNRGKVRPELRNQADLYQQIRLNAFSGCVVNRDEFSRAKRFRQSVEELSVTTLPDSESFQDLQIYSWGCPR